jgi:hypothetical protein
MLSSFKNACDHLILEQVTVFLLVDKGSYLYVDDCQLIRATVT